MIMHDHHLPAEAGRQEGGQHEQERHAANQMMSERLHRYEKLALALGQHNPQRSMKTPSVFQRRLFSSPLHFRPALQIRFRRTKYILQCFLTIGLHLDIGQVVGKQAVMRHAIHI